MAKWDQVKFEERDLSFFINGLKAFWSLLEHNRDKVRNIIIWIVIVEMVYLALPYLFKLMLDEMIVLVRTGMVSRYLYWVIAISFSSMVLTLALDRLLIEKKFLHIIIAFENWIPANAQKKLLDLSLGYHERENTGETVAKIYKGCSKLVDIVSQIRWGFFPKFVYMIVNALIIMLLDWRLGMIFFVPFIPALWIHWKGWKRVAPVWEAWDEKYEYSSRQFDQSIRHISTVQSYAQEQREKEDFLAVRNEMEKMDLEAGLYIQKYFFLTGLILKTSFYLAIVAGIFMVIRGESSVGTIFYLAVTGNTTSQNLWQLINEYNQISRKLIAVVRMKELLDEMPEIVNDCAAVIPGSYEGEFRFEKIEFRYPEKDSAVLNGIDLEIHPHQMVALVGRSGEGKTTAFRLLTRAYEPDCGKVTLDGADIRKLDLYWYRRLFAVVQQDVDIFDKTILDNIRYAHPEASEKMVEEAVRAAYLDYILTNAKRFPMGLKTLVGERGVRLSGGEKQRVGIARAYLALLNGAKVLVLDEATSNLDSQAERAIQEMIDDLRAHKNISIVAIAHRLSTIARSDMIYVISDGKVIEKGDHEKLQLKNGLYSELVKYQQLGELRD